MTDFDWLVAAEAAETMNHRRDELAGLREDSVVGAVTRMFHSNGLC